MSVKINHSTKRVNLPTVTLSGFVVQEDGSYHKTNVLIDVDPSETQTWTVSGKKTFGLTNPQILIDGMTVTKRKEIVFIGNVDLSISSDSKYHTKKYPSSYTFIGKRKEKIEEINLNSETYYTLNGKDPIRTKNYLYTGPIVIRRNSSGSDKTTLKVRTFTNGLKSEVMKIEFRILLENDKEI